MPWRVKFVSIIALPAFSPESSQKPKQQRRDESIPLRTEITRVPSSMLICKKRSIRRVFTVRYCHCEERLLRARGSGGYKKTMFSGYSKGSRTYKLTVVVTSCTRPEQAQARSDLTMKIFSIGSWWERVSQSSLQLWPLVGSCFSGQPHIQKYLGNTNSMWA